MQLSPELKHRIDEMVRNDRVVLFMKGTPQAPRCGFSAAVVEMLDGLVDGYSTHDVLADAELREGIKAYSEWPTIPQLYISGEFVGGADITKEMFSSGELHKLLGIEPRQAAAPRALTVTLTPAAARALAEARGGEAADHRFLRLIVSKQFQHQLSFGPELPGDSSSMSEGIEIRVDASSAARADGIRIDFVSSPTPGFRIDNPNEPPRVRNVGVRELKALLDDARASGRSLALFDVRTPGEQQTAAIADARLLDDDTREHIASLPRDTPLYFMCHHGGRSQAAADQFLREGFKRVYNVEGGIDAWSTQVDPGVARY